MNTIPQSQIDEAKALIEKSSSVLIAVSSNHTFDEVAAGLSLYLSLTAQGKRVAIVSPVPMTVEYSHLVGLDLIGGSLNNSGSRNLVISFPYQEGSIEKVSYNIENDTFNLVIEPREGYPQVTEEVIQYSYSGGAASDSVITVGAASLEDLGNLYTANRVYFDGKPIITFHTSSHPSFGKINISNASVSSFSELMTAFLSQTGISMDADVSTNLLAGISAETANFSSPATTASTFETAALCLRNGARILATQMKREPAYIPTPVRRPAPAPRMPRPPFSQQPVAGPQSPPSGKYPFMGKPFAKPVTPPYMPQQQQYQQPKQGQQGAKQPPETPSDWLKPKIYKSSSLV